jgi:hypothetical protein
MNPNENSPALQTADSIDAATAGKKKNKYIELMDKEGTPAQNWPMLRIQLILLLLVGGNSIAAQQPVVTAPKSEPVAVPAGSLPYDPAKVAAAIRDSNYHPDELSGLDCDLSIDWPALFTSLKANLATDRLKTLQGLKVRSHAARGNAIELTLQWTDGKLDTKQQMEDGLKQMVGGFYQMYWPMVASSSFSKASDYTRIDPEPNGGAKLYSSSQNMSLVVTIDKDSTPTHLSLESPVMNGTFDFQYTPSPRPVPGDLRRISAITASEKIGDSAFNLKLDLDYQEVGGFNVPRHVNFGLVGAYSIAMEFSGCSVSRGATNSE